MSALILLTLIGYCFAENYEYSAEQGNVTLAVLPDNPYLKLHSNESEYPTGIEYLQNIEPGTPLMVRVIFGDKNGPLDRQNAENTRLNICEILARDLNDPASSQRRYHMASALGLKGKRCPIKKGLKPIVPYVFPRQFRTKDLGFGDRYFAMRVETMDQVLESVPIMELYVQIKLNKTDQTYNQSASPAVLLPSIVAGIVIILQISKFIK